VPNAKKNEVPEKNLALCRRQALTVPDTIASAPKKG
jgi:hypothetical protein